MHLRQRVPLLRWPLPQGGVGTVDDKTEKLEPVGVDRSIVYHIYGGSNVIAANAATIQQAGRDLITAGDTAGLIKALWNFGVTDDDAKKIIHSLAEDSGSQASPSLGQKTIGVIKTVAGKVASAGKNISVSVATSVITQMVLQYLGSGPIPT
jgi:hypothetical protein